MLIRSLCALAVLCIFLLGCASAGNKSNLCLQDDNALTCLKENFEGLYAQNYNRFWNIANRAASEAEKCNSPDNTAAFLYLVRIKKGNAEFNEFFSGVIERLVTEKTDCLLVALTRMELVSQRLIMGELKHPLFAESAAIEKAFRAAGEGRYKSTVNLYFEQRE